MNVKSGQLATENHLDLVAAMQSAVTQLGIDPMHHKVRLEPHQLLIHDLGEVEAHTLLKFEEQPAGIIHQNII